MTVMFENNLGEDLHEHNGMLELLTNCGAGLLAGWAPSYRQGATIFLNEGSDNFTFNVEGADDCRLFGRLFRIYVRILEERCAAFEKKHGRAVGHADRSFGAHALLRRDELPHLLEIAEFFERSQWVRRTS